jgi:hypothetical protein
MNIATALRCAAIRGARTLSTPSSFRTALLLPLLFACSFLASAAHGQDRELHVVGVYQGVGGFSSGATHLEGTVSVNVNRPAKAVTLFLSSYEPVLWKITATEGTTIEKVYASGYYAQRVQGVDPSVPIVSQSYENGTGYLLVGYSIESAQFLASVPKVHALTGLEISSFHGAYEATPDGVFTIASVQDDPRLRSDFPQPVPDAELPDPALLAQKFTVNFQGEGGVVTREYTLRGPTNSSSLFPRGFRVIADETGHVFYGAEQHTFVKIDTVAGTEEYPPYELVAPEGWPMGTAFDSKRGRVVVINLSGEGALYGSVAPHTEWSFLASADNRDIDSIEYHAADDSYYAVSTSYGDSALARIYHLSAAGTYLGEIRLPTLPYGIGFGTYRSEIVSFGDYLVVLLGPQGFIFSGETPDQRIYLVDPRSGKSWLTFRNPRTEPNRAPTVKIVAPADGSVFAAGSQIKVGADAVDSDGAIDRVEFFANSQRIGEGVNVGGSRYEVEWTVPPGGSYSIVARAFDKEGLDALSTPIRVSVQAKQAPIVRIIAPVNDARLRPQTEVNLDAEATDLDGSVLSVQFLADGQNIGTAERIDDRHFRFVWKTPEAGSFILLARASDNDGAVGTSAPVRVTIGANAAPRVRVITPEAGAVLRAGVDARLVAEAFDPDGRIQAVEFFANGQSLGVASPSPLAVFRAIFQIIWRAPVPGEYSLAAKATDNDGATTMSGPVRVTVIDSPVVAIRHLPRAYRPGTKFRVRIVIDPQDDVTVEAIRDKAPAGWKVGNITSGGTFDPETGTVLFGPFADGRRRVLGYQLSVPDDASGPQTFTGEALVAGMAIPIRGDQVITQRFRPPPPEDNQGIEGVVYQQSAYRSFTAVGIPFPPWPVKANYSIEEIVPPNVDRATFVWSGVTDDQGKFHVMTPPGLFKVTASRIPQPGDTTQPPATASIEVRVIAGAFANVALYLPPDGTIYPPPPADTGIKGLVLAPPGGPLAARPLPNAPVTVEEITDVVVGRARLRWTGKTDADGRFQTSTYPGRYRVTATQFDIFKETVEVTVREHAYTDVTLIIENTMVGPVATP